MAALVHKPSLLIGDKSLDQWHFCLVDLMRRAVRITCIALFFFCIGWACCFFFLSRREVVCSGFMFRVHRCLIDIHTHHSDIHLLNLGRIMQDME